MSHEGDVAKPEAPIVNVEDLMQLSVPEIEERIHLVDAEIKDRLSVDKLVSAGLKEANAKLESARKSRDELAKERSVIEEQINSRQKTHVKDAAKLDEKVKQLEVTLVELTGKCDNITAEIEMKMDDSKNGIESVRQRIVELEKELAEMDAVLDDLKGVTEHEKELSIWKTRVIELESHLSKHQSPQKGLKIIQSLIRPTTSKFVEEIARKQQTAESPAPIKSSSTSPQRPTAAAKSGSVKKRRVVDDEDDEEEVEDESDAAKSKRMRQFLEGMTLSLATKPSKEKSPSKAANKASAPKAAERKKRGSDYSATTCSGCDDLTDHEAIVLCDLCDKGYHLSCVQLKQVPSGSWFCPTCRSSSHKKLKEKSSSKKTSKTTREKPEKNDNEDDTSLSSLSSTSSSESEEEAVKKKKEQPTEPAKRPSPGSGLPKAVRKTVPIDQ